MKQSITVLAAGLLLAGHVQASDTLSCQLKESAGEGTAFAWSHAHGEADGPDAIETSVGTIGWAEGPDFTTVITLDGEAIDLPPEHAGLIRSGRVYEHDGQVAMAYLVERERDSSASPSELVFLVRKDRSVSDIHLQPGNAEPVAGHCTLIQ